MISRSFRLTGLTMMLDFELFKTYIKQQSLELQVELNAGFLICQFGTPGFIRTSNNLCMVANEEDSKFMLKMK